MEGKFNSTNAAKYVAFFLILVFFQYSILKINQGLLINDEWRFLIEFLDMGPENWFSAQNLYRDRGGAIIPLNLLLLGISFDTNLIGPTFHQMIGAFGYAFSFLIFFKIFHFWQSLFIRNPSTSLSLIFGLIGSAPFIWQHLYHNIISFNFGNLYIFFYFLASWFLSAIKHEGRTQIFYFIGTVFCLVLFGQILNFYFFLIALVLVNFYQIYNKQVYSKEKSNHLTSGNRNNCYRLLYRLCLLFLIFAIGVISFNLSEIKGGRLGLLSLVGFIKYAAMWCISPFAYFLGVVKTLSTSHIVVFGGCLFVMAAWLVIECVDQIRRKFLSTKFLILIFLLGISAISCIAVYVGNGYNKLPTSALQHRFLELQIPILFSFFCVVYDLCYRCWYKGSIFGVHIKPILIERGVVAGLTVLVLALSQDIAQFDRAVGKYKKRIDNWHVVFTDDSVPCWKRIGFWKPLPDDYCRKALTGYLPLFKERSNRIFE